MPQLTNASQEIFAQTLATGTTKSEAYEIAGYEPNRHNAARLVNTNEHVQQRIREIQFQAVDLTQITVASLVGAADEAREAALAEKQISAAVAAIKEMGILTGLRIDRREVGKPGEFERMNDEELAHFIASESAKLIDLPPE